MHFASDGLRAFFFKTQFNDRSTISHIYTSHLLPTKVTEDMSSHYKHTIILSASHSLFSSLTSNSQSSLAQHMKEAGRSSVIHHLFKLLWSTGMCRGKMLWRWPSRSSFLLYFITLHHPLAFLLLLLLLLWVVDADGEHASFCAVLVLDHEGILSGVCCCDSSDCDAGKLAVLELEFVVLVGHQFLVILRPAHLRRGLAPDIACQVQGLKRKRGLEEG